MVETGKVLPNCVNASNPYHECGDYCITRLSEAKQKKGKKGSIILEARRSFGRKKKEAEYKEKPLEVINNVEIPRLGSPADAASSRSDLSSKLKAELMAELQPSSEQNAKEMNGHNPALRKGQIQVSESRPESPKGPAKHNTTSRSNGISTGNEQDKLFKDVPSSPQIVSSPMYEDVIQGSNGPDRFMSSNSFGIPQSLDESDEEEAQSVISDSESRVWVGKYLVKANISSILQSIFDKYGDIAAGCQLESLSVRTYYLECVSFVVQELQSTPVIHLSKPKVKEMLAILKDVESSNINVSWLHSILDEIAESIEQVSQQRAIEINKTNCDQALESTKKELESQIEDLARKEKEFADAKARVAETEKRLWELESEYSQLNENFSLIRSKLEKFHSKPLMINSLGQF